MNPSAAPAPRAVYLVGGAVRDALLGITVHDRDYVVTGFEPQELLDQGFVPVGKDFPVFLHPSTKEEVALARTERKTAAGYHGFAIHAAAHVRIEEDLARRDLTINSIAVSIENSRTNGKKGQKINAKSLIEAAQEIDWPRAVRERELVDPFGGQIDLAERRLRHVTNAFAEDPVRILRLARFAARFPEFSVAPETQALVQAMVSAGEVDALVPERVWQEIERGLMAQEPTRMLRVLHECAALKRVAPELVALLSEPQSLRGLTRSTDMGLGLSARFAVMCHRLPAADVGSLCKRWRVPQHLRELALLASQEHAPLWASDAAQPAELLGLLQRCDAFRRAQRLEELLAACSIAASSPHRFERLRQAWAAAQRVDSKKIALDIENQWTNQERVFKNRGELIQQALTSARIAAIVQVFSVDATRSLP